MDPELIKRLMDDVKRATEMGLPREAVDAYIMEESQGRIDNAAMLFKAALGDEKPGKGSLWRPALQGAAFRFGDELAGAGAALVPGGRGYREGRDHFRAQEARTRDAYPKASVAAEVAGGIAVPGLGTAGTAARGVRGGIGLARAGGIGAAVGAGTGAVAAAGDAAELSDVPGAAVSGAAGGAVVGGALGALLRPVAALFGGMGKLLQDIVAPDAAVSRRARSLVSKALSDAGLTPDEAMQAMRDLERAAPGQSMLADVSPRMGRELRTSVNSAPGLEVPLREQLGSRQAGQASRLASGLEADMGVTGAGAREARLQAGQSRSTLGRRVYEPLEDQVVETEGVVRQLADPDVMRMTERARPTDEGLTFGRVQRLIQDMQDARGAAFRSGRGNEGNSWRERVQALTAEVDKAAPGFRAANREYGVASTVTSAFQRGAKALDASAADVADEVAKLRRSGGTEAVDAYRMGFIEKLTTQLRQRTTNRNAATSIAEMGDDTRKIFRVLFPDEASYRSFMERARAERTFAATRNAATGNSTTSQQLMDAGSSAAVDAVQGGRTGGVFGTLAALAARGGRAVMGDVNERARESVGRRLMSGPTAELDEYLQRLRRGSGFDLMGRAAAQVGAPAAGGRAGFDLFGE